MMNPEDAHKKAEYCINKVLALDKNLPDVYAVTAGKNFWIEWNFTNRKNPFYVKYDPETGNLKTINQFGLMPELLYRITF